MRLSTPTLLALTWLFGCGEEEKPPPPEEAEYDEPGIPQHSESLAPHVAYNRDWPAEFKTIFSRTKSLPWASSTIKVYVAQATEKDDIKSAYEVTKPLGNDLSYKRQFESPEGIFFTRVVYLIKSFKTNVLYFMDVAFLPESDQPRPDLIQACNVDLVEKSPKQPHPPCGLAIKHRDQISSVFAKDIEASIGDRAICAIRVGYTEKGGTTRYLASPAIMYRAE